MISETDKIKQKKLFDIFRNCGPEVIGHGDPQRTLEGLDNPRDCVSPWEPDVVFLHGSEDFSYGDRQNDMRIRDINIWDEHIVIRHPFNYSFCIVIKREFAEKILVLGGLP